MPPLLPPLPPPNPPTPPLSIPPPSSVSDDPVVEYHDDGPREVAHQEGMRDQVSAAFQPGPIGGGESPPPPPPPPLPPPPPPPPPHLGAVGRHLLPDRRHEAGAPLMGAPAAVTARGGCRLRPCLCDPPSHGGGGLARRPPTSMPRRRRRRRAPPPPSVRRPWAGGILKSQPGPTSSSAAVLAAICRYVTYLSFGVQCCCW